MFKINKNRVYVNARYHDSLNVNDKIEYDYKYLMDKKLDNTKNSVS